MDVKVSELSGAALDWAVGIAEQPDGAKLLWRLMQTNRWKPSTDWAQGGPIIEHERLLIEPEIGKEGAGNAWSAVTMSGKVAYGATVLIAAMRCFVASKLGDVVSIPDELL